MSRSRRRRVEVETAEELDRLAVRRAVDARLAGAGPRPARPRRDPARARPGRRAVPRLHLRPGRRGAATRRWRAGLPGGPRRARRRLPLHPLHPRRAVRRPGRRLLRGHARRPGLRLVDRRRARPAGPARPLAARPRRRRRPRGVRRRAPRRRRDGRARPAARLPRLRRRRRVGPCPGPVRAHRGHRRRTGRDGGGQPRRPPGRAPRRRAARRARGAGPGAVLRPGRRRLGARGVRGAGRPAGGRWPRGGSAGGSLGIPTWFYGHEPPNAFASQIAKYFSNAIREDTLLHVCTAGVVFLPGRGGTVQEVFQDACENYYATAETVAPMVLVGPGVLDRGAAGVAAAALARGGPGHGDRVHLVDDLDEVGRLLGWPHHGRRRHCWASLPDCPGAPVRGHQQLRGRRPGRPRGGLGGADRPRPAAAADPAAARASTPTATCGAGSSHRSPCSG